MAKKMVIKKSGKKVFAYELGAGSVMEKRFISEGKIKVRADGTYELFSQECNSGSGEIAHPGDFFKVDGSGFPYPNERIWFDANHRHIEGECYEQLPKPLEAWEYGDEIDERIEFLVMKKGLILNPKAPKEYFGAKLWKSWLTAAKDAVLVFYSITRDESGNIIDADFNFVARAEFEASYRYC